MIDTIEFKTIKDDAEDIVRELRLNAKKAKNPKIAKKMESEADRLEESIAKYSKKDTKKESLEYRVKRAKVKE